MEDNHVDVVKDSKNIACIFSLFSNLLSEQNHLPKHCLKLLQFLSRSNFRVGSISNIDYTVKRLLRGLGSTRLHLQAGCFAALTAILKYRLYSIEKLLEILEKEHRHFEAGASKGESKAIYTRCVLTYGVVIHSGSFGNQPAEIQENVLRKLIESGNKKSYLSSVVNHFLVDIVNLFNKQQFKNIFWPICKTELFQNLDHCGPDAFYLLLICKGKNCKLLNNFLEKNFTSAELLVEKTIECLLNNTVRSCHPLYKELSLLLCSDLTLLGKFWPKCVNENAKVNSYKDSVLVILFSYIIESLDDGTVVPKLLVPQLVQIILQVLSYTKKNKSKNYSDECFKRTKSAIQVMINILSSKGTPDKARLSTIKRLLFYPANMKFEMKTGTKCIHTLVSHLSCDSTKDLVNLYKKLISGEMKKKVSEGVEEDWSSKEKQDVLFFFTKILNHPSLKGEISWKLEQIKFIFGMGFLNKNNVHKEVQKCAKACFFKAVTVQMPSLKELVNFLDELAVHLNKCLKNGNVKVDEEFIELWDKMFSLLETLKKKPHKSFIAVHILLIHMGFQLFRDRELAKGGIEELQSCYQHLQEFHRKKQSSLEDGPHWTEVTVDLILSLLSRENKVWRHVVSYVFPQVTMQLTPTALHQIIDALDPKSENQVLRHLNSDESDAESEEDEEEEGSSSTSSESEGGDLEEEEEEEEEGKPNDQLRLAVRKALGYSAAQTDDESIDMDDMNEEEERRLNESLAEAFRQFKTKSRGKKKKQTKEEEALTHFRLRVLDLMEMYLTGSPSMGGCLDFIPPLLDVLELSIRDHHQRPLQVRAESVLKQLSAVKTFSDSDNVSQGIIKDVFQSVVGRREKAGPIFMGMLPRVSELSAFLVRCSQLVNDNDDADGVPLAEEFEALAQKVSESRDNKFPISIFCPVIRTNWKGNFILAANFLHIITNPKIRIFNKLKGMELLKIFYENDKLHASCDKAFKSELTNFENNFANDLIDLLSIYEKDESILKETKYVSFYSNLIMLINTIKKNSTKHRAGIKNSPSWMKLVEKMAGMKLITNTRKTRSQLGNLANFFDVPLPASEKTTARKRTSSQSSVVSKEEIDGEEEEEENLEPKRKKWKRTKSAGAMRLKKESRKIREEISSDGLTLVRFSTVDAQSLPSGREAAGEQPEPREMST